MKTKKLKIFAIVLIGIGILLIISGIVLGILSGEKATPQPPPEITEEEKRAQNEKKAREILEQLSIDKFFAIYLTNPVETEKNILDISDAAGINKYLLGSKNVEKYILVYENPSNTDMIYVKYADFITETKKVFNTEPTYDYKNTTMSFPNLTKNDTGKYNTTLDNVGICDLTGNTDNCYVLISSGDLQTSKGAEFSDLELEDNIIKGYVKKYHDISDKKIYVDGNFVFEFEKVNDQYIIKSLKMV